jgi:hypothetical protein
VVCRVFQRLLYRAHTSVAIQDLNESFLNLKEDPDAISPTVPLESYCQTQGSDSANRIAVGAGFEKPAIAQALDRETTHRGRFEWREF